MVNGGSVVFYPLAHFTSTQKKRATWSAHIAGGSLTVDDAHDCFVTCLGMVDVVLARSTCSHKEGMSMTLLRLCC